MKSLFLSLVIILVSTISIKAQEIPETFKPKDFKLDTSFKVLPDFKFNENSREPYLTDNKLDGIYLREPSLSLDNLELQAQLPSQDNMPVYNPLFYVEMPILEPDSSVNFHMKVKEVGK